MLSEDQAQVPPRGLLSTVILVWGVVAATFALLLVRNSVPSDAQTFTYAATILPMLASLGWVVIRGKPWARGAWAIIFLVLMLHVLGLLIRQITQDGQRSADLATAGPADAIFAVAYGTALLAFAIMVRLVHRRPEPLWSIDALIVFIAVWTIGAEAILSPLEGQGAGLFSIVIQGFYITVNAGLLALAMRLGLTSVKGINRALRLGLLSVSLFAVNDLVSTAGIITGTQEGVRNGIYTAVNILAIGLASAAATDPTVVNAPAKTPHEGRLSAVRSVMAVLLVSFVVVTVAYSLRDLVDPLEVLLMSLVGGLVALLAARSVALVSAYRQLVMREATLRESTAAMLDADTDAVLDRELTRAAGLLLPADDITWRWRQHLGESTREDSGVVTVNQAPEQDPNVSSVNYRYGYAVGGEELDVELVTTLLLDPLDWAGVQALTETAAQARSRHRLREEREAAAEAARMSAMLAGAQDMVVLLDDQHVIRHALGAVGELTGQEPQYWIGRSVTEVFDDPHHVIQVAVDTRTKRHRLMARLRDSAAQVEVTVVRSGSGEVSVSMHDVTTRMKLTKELEHRAHHDLLTGLPNRSYLEMLLGRAGDRWRTGGVPFAVVYLDIDDFKVVNDSLGHRLGDALLAELAVQFTSAVGTRGTVARIGGDEFAVLMPSGELEVALSLADELVNQVLAKPLTLDGVEVQVRVSAGVAAAADRISDDGEQVLQAADLALYDARARGKAHVAPFREELRDRAARKLHDANAVTSAAREQAFRFDYQPIVNIAEHEVVAMEALMRWDRGEDLQRPDAFIPIAESLGELTRMLRDVLPSALAQLQVWRRTCPDVMLAVNVHAGALQDHEFVDWFADTVTSEGLPLEAVIVEVSERTLVPTGADRNLSRLRQRNVPIWIDDFGTGWSNLSSLERLPVTGVKLARELVVDDVGGVKSDLVSAVLRLADAVGFVVTAEGVETTDQVESLAALGVSVVQGYLVGRPMNAQDALKWLEHYSSAVESV